MRLGWRGNRSYDAEHCVSFATILDGFVDYSVFGNDLIGTCLRKIRHSDIIVAEVYLSEASIEKDFGRIKFELEAQLFVIAGNERASAETPGRKVPKNKDALREAPRVWVSLGSDTHIAWFPRKYSNESSKSRKARSNRSNRKLETPHWK